MLVVAFILTPVVRKPKYLKNDDVARPQDSVER